MTGPTPAARLAGSHGLLMTFGFLGTLIALERAVALGRPWGYAAPLASGLAGALLIAGWAGSRDHDPDLAGLDRLPGDVPDVHRHGPRAPHLGPGGRGGGLGPRRGAPPGRPAGRGRRPRARRVPDPHGGRGAPGAGADGHAHPGQAAHVPGRRGGVRTRGRGSDLAPGRGLRLGGVGLLALAAWLARYDIARRTVRLPGVTRFIALCLLAGYALAGRRRSGVAGLRGRRAAPSPGTRCSTPCSSASSSPWSTATRP